MPIYEYRCNRCKQKVTVFTRSFSQAVEPRCDRCGSEELTRLFSPVALLKSSGESLDVPDLGGLGDVDENDPRAMREMVRRLKREMGDEAADLDEDELLEGALGGGLGDEGDEEHGEGDEEE
jgi:putative FmdB family regulatory protein